MSSDEDPADKSTAEFWSEHYATRDTPWLIDRIPNALSAFIGRAKTPAAHVLIPGCGTDHLTISAFAEAGFQVTAMDFSATAIEQAKEAVRNSNVKLILGDFFRHDFGPEKFDIVYERTFLCALPPATWQEYAERVAQLLHSGGLLAGLFFFGSEPDPPPYPITPEETQSLFGKKFRQTRDEPVTDSIEMFAGMERWQEWLRR